MQISRSDLTNDIFFKPELEIYEEKPQLMKSDELNMGITAHRAWNPSSAVQYLPKQNIILQNNSSIRMRIYGASDPYEFVKEINV